MAENRRLVASYLKRDELPGPVVMAVSEGGRDIATAEMPDTLPGHDDPDAVLAGLGFRRVPGQRWRHTARAANVEVERVS